MKSWKATDKYIEAISTIGQKWQRYGIIFRCGLEMKNEYIFMSCRCRRMDIYIYGVTLAGRNVLVTLIYMESDMAFNIPP